MYHALGALILLVGIVVLIKYIMRTGETKNSCSVENKISPSEDDMPTDDEVVKTAGIELDIKDKE